MNEQRAATPQERTAHACEPCRRKKTRCPGERPECSYCKRLGQPCRYVGRDGENSSRKRRRVESTVTDGPAGGSSTQAPSSLEQILSSESNMKSLINAWGPVQALVKDRQSLLLPDDASTALIDLYRDYFHGQPFLLFEPAEMLGQINQWPRHLLCAFHALIIPYAQGKPHTHELTNVARQAVMSEFNTESGTQELITSLCIIAFLEIDQNEATAAYLHIGMAIRMCEALLSQSGPSTHLDERLCGCIWTATYLNQTFFLGPAATRPIPTDSRVISRLPNPSPQSIEDVDGIELPSNERYSTVLPSQASNTSIYGEILTLLNVWALAQTLIQDVKTNKTKELWLPNSPYDRARQALLEWETNHSPRHRLQHCKFETRSPSDILRYLNYWHAWILHQLLYHTSNLLIHHPLLHTLPTTDAKAQVPPSFRQHAIDQSMLHAKWVARLIRRSREKGLQPEDPFVAHLVAVAASVLIFFAHSSNERIRAEANHGLDVCLDFVSRSALWRPHLRHMEWRLKTLRQSTANRHEPRPIAQSSLLWELLQYSSSTSPPTHNQKLGPVELDITTEHLAPVDEPTAVPSDTTLGEPMTESLNRAGEPAGDIVAEEFDVLESFDALLADSIFDNTWYDPAPQTPL